jgi:ribose/xylose/arabinose/galactoside ABC-type transport system permease subunit
MVQTKHKSKPSSNIARDVVQRFLRHENAALGMVLIVSIVIVAALSRGVSVRPVNMSNVLLQSSIRGLASIGQAFVILTGGIDVSVGGIATFAAIVGAQMMTEAPWLNTVGYPVSIYVAIPVTIIVGALWGALNGSLVSRIGIPALIVTLGMWQVSDGFALSMTGGRTIFHLPAELTFYGQGKVAGIPVPVLILVGVVVVAYFVLNYTAFGRSIYASGGNPVSAWLSGVNVRRTQLTVYIISGFLAGLAGAIMTARVASAAMTTVEGLEIESIASVSVGGISLVGGKGNIIGVVLGVLIIGVISNAMSVLGASLAVQNVVMGSIIILAVAIDCIRRSRR